MNPETFSLIYLLKSEIQRKIAQNNFAVVTKQLRHFISLCNSILVKLIQSGDISEIEFILKKSSKADSLLVQHGCQADRFWQGRIVAWLVKGYYYLSTSNGDLALKTMYAIHLLIENLQDAGGILNVDLKIVTNFFSFVVLWTANRLESCEEFLKVAKKALESEKKEGKLNLDEMKVLVNMGLAALKIKLLGNVRFGLKVLSETCERFRGRGLVCYRLLVRFLAECCKEQDFAYLGEFGNREILVTKEMKEVMLEVCVVPFIEEKCPMVEEPKLEGTGKSFVSYSDKVSTRSSHSRSEGSEGKYGKINNMLNLYYRPKVVQGKPNIYSPILGVVRPNSNLKVRTFAKTRPKSTGKVKRLYNP